MARTRKHLRLQTRLALAFCLLMSAVAGVGGTPNVSRPDAGAQVAPVPAMTEVPIAVARGD